MSNLKDFKDKITGFSSYTASDVLNKLKTVDGPDSELNADLLDGHEDSYFLPAGSYTESDVLNKLKTVDGPGSELDADLLDGHEASYFLPAGSYTESDVLNKLKTVDGDGSGLDADLLDGHHANYFSISTHLHNDIYLNENNNLSDLNDPNIARNNLGLGNVPNLDFSNASNITSGVLPSSVLPPLAITTTQIASDQAAMLALTTQEGDVVIRTDESKSYIHNGGNTGTMTDFTELSTPIDSVLSVNNKTGSIILTQDDIANGSTYVRTTNDFTNSEKTKLNNIENGATADQTASEILSLIKTVDGDGSGLDADLLDGHSSSYFLPAVSYTASDVLNKLKTVDGPGSGLNADLLDGYDSKILRGQSSGSTADPNVTLETYLLTNHANGPGSGYWHIRTQWYSNITTSSNCAQIAIQYNGGAATYTRSRYNNVWQPWVRLDNNANDILTKLKTVDGPGSGLNADLLDGHNASYFSAASHNHASLVNGSYNATLDSNGSLTISRYLYSQHVNISHGIGTRNSDTVFYSSTDAYIRKNTAAGMIASLGLDSRYLKSSGENSAGTFTNMYVNSAIYSVGDTNTYIQFHASDQWRVVAGGAEKLEVNTGAVKCSVEVQAPSFNSTSKRSAKENIKIFENNAVDLINSVDVVSFNFKADENKTYHVGFIADDTDPIFSGENQDHMDHVNLLGVLLKAVQELSLRIEKLEG